ncbi:MAG: TonB family protein [Bacteroidales bacterium]|jgi:TonB family protein|nr:TonB family protein [Bacteroidales bacterium]
MRKYIFVLLFMNLASWIMAQEKATIQIGDYRISALSDSKRDGKTNILIDAAPDLVAQYIPSGVYPSEVVSFLVQSPEKNILIDAGLGLQLLANLESFDLTPDRIDAVALTHAHGDHIGGLLRDGKVVFPNASLFINRLEYDYWINGNNQLAKNVLTAYKDQLALFDVETGTGSQKGNILPGFQAIAAYGHTPGHTLYLITSGISQLLVLGDLTHVTPLQMPHPEIAVTYDVDPKQAVESRKKILEYVAEYNIPVAGMHIPYPSIGYVKTAETGYDFWEMEINGTQYDVPDALPTFPGGQQAMTEFIAQHLSNSHEAVQKAISENVILKFVVAEDGSIEDIQIVKSVDPLLDAEVVRIVKLMPRWKPGIQNGKAVRTTFLLPFRF